MLLWQDKGRSGTFRRQKKGSEGGSRQGFFPGQSDVWQVAVDEGKKESDDDEGKEKIKEIEKWGD